MKSLLKRVGYRITLPVFAVFYLLAWALAVPWQSLDYFDRRDHFRDFKDAFGTSKAWSDMARAWRTGRNV